MGKDEAWQFILQFYKSRLADDEAELMRLEMISSVVSLKQEPTGLRESIEQRKKKLKEFEDELEKGREP